MPTVLSHSRAQALDALMSRSLKTPEGRAVAEQILKDGWIAPHNMEAVRTQWNRRVRLMYRVDPPKSLRS